MRFMKRKKFKDMLLEKKDTPEGMAVILSMAAMLEGRSEV